jgi:hypothetical protein
MAASPKSSRRAAGNLRVSSARVPTPTSCPPRTATAPSRTGAEVMGSTQFAQ